MPAAGNGGPALAIPGSSHPPQPQHQQPQHQQQPPPPQVQPSAGVLPLPTPPGAVHPGTMAPPMGLPAPNHVPNGAAAGTTIGATYARAPSTSQLPPNPTIQDLFPKSQQPPRPAAAAAPIAAAAQPPRANPPLHQGGAGMALPSLDRRQEIDMLIQTQQYDEAFSKV